MHPPQPEGGKEVLGESEVQEAIKKASKQIILPKPPNAHYSHAVQKYDQTPIAYANKVQWGAEKLVGRVVCVMMTRQKIGLKAGDGFDRVRR